MQSDRLLPQPNWLPRSFTLVCWRPDGDECLFLFVKSPVLLPHARQNEKQIKEAGNRHREDVWLLAIELSALFTPNETTFQHCSLLNIPQSLGRAAELPGPERATLDFN